MKNIRLSWKVLLALALVAGALRIVLESTKNESLIFIGTALQFLAGLMLIFAVIAFARALFSKKNSKVL
jgi:hypothetical protein